MPPARLRRVACSLALGLLLAPPALAQGSPPPPPPQGPSEGPGVPPLLRPEEEAALSRGRSRQEAAGLHHIHLWLQHEGGEPLQHRSTSFLLPTGARPAKGIVVLFHGFSAGTWQVEPMARRLAAAGFHAFAPRLPGHGLVDGEGRESPAQLPTTSDWRRYLDFAQEVGALAEGTGLPVSGLGLSVGATVGLAMAEGPTPVRRFVALAPFLEPLRGGLSMAAVELLDGPTGGWAGRQLGKVGWGWGPETEAQTASGLRPGHAIFPLGCVAGATRLGHEVRARASRLDRTELQWVTTGADDTVALGEQRKAIAALPAGRLRGWHHFPTSAQVPHPMLHEQEAKGSPHVPGLEALCLRFLAEGQGSWQLPGPEE